MIELRTATDDELATYVAIWNAITPEEPADVVQQRERRDRHPERLYLLARLDGQDVGAGFGGPSDSPGRGFVSPRVLPGARRRGVGAKLLRALADHLAAQDYETCSAHVDGNDEGSLAFAERFGFEEVDRQVEQVLAVAAAEPVEPPAGIRFVTIEQQHELLEAAYDLATEGYADLAVSTPVEVPLEDWLRDEATLPGGSVVALAGDEIVGYSGLVRTHEEDVAEDGLAVVRRAWRRRGLATALKREKIAWAAANGIRELVTWTQRGNEGMRAVNEALGYEYRSVSITVRAPLPLR
jgi:L-amino acid N-acyltransferase YncA